MEQGQQPTSTTTDRLSFIDFDAEDTETSILRATPAYEILHFGGRLLKNSSGSEATFSLSESCDEIDAFVSHNWSASATLKVLALANHFNSLPALAVSGVVVMITTMLAIFEIGPATHIENHDLETQRQFGRLLATPAFFITLFLWPELQKLCGGRSAKCFLDKVCIHQTDINLKLRGIRKLGAFLNKSSTFVVCYTDVYLRKLWTVYEVACWVLVCPEKPMKIKHLNQLGVVMSLHLVLYFTENIQIFSDIALTISPYISLASVLLVPCTIYADVQHQILMWERVSLFKVSEAMCFDENDRPLVEGNIISLMKFKGCVSENASRQHTLEVFESIVKEYVKNRVKRAFGKHGIRYRTMLPIIYVLYLPYGFDLWGSFVAQGQLGWSIVSFLHLTWRTLMLYPLMLVLQYHALTKLCLTFRQQRIFRILLVMGFELVFCVAWFFFSRTINGSFMRNLWDELSMFVPAYCCFFAISIVVTFCVFSEWCPGSSQPHDVYLPKVEFPNEALGEMHVLNANSEQNWPSNLHIGQVASMVHGAGGEFSKEVQDVIPSVTPEPGISQNRTFEIGGFTKFSL